MNGKKIIKGMQDARDFSKLRAIHDALEFYGKMDCKAGIPAEASPAMPAMNYAKELIAMEGRSTREDVERFNANPSSSLQEKLTLYLCGLGHLAREIMVETNATDFTTSTTLEPKNGGMTVDVEVTVKKSKD